MLLNTTSGTEISATSALHGIWTLQQVVFGSGGNGLTAVVAGSALTLSSSGGFSRRTPGRRIGLRRKSLDWVGLVRLVALVGRVGRAWHGLGNSIVACGILRVRWTLVSIVSSLSVMSSSRLVRDWRRSERGGNRAAGLGVNWQVVGVVLTFAFAALNFA